MCDDAWPSRLGVGMLLSNRREREAKRASEWGAKPPTPPSFFFFLFFSFEGRASVPEEKEEEEEEEKSGDLKVTIMTRTLD